MPAKVRRARNPHPFPYFGQGVFAGRKDQRLVVAFEKGLALEHRDRVREDAPPVFNHFEWSDDRTLHAGHVGALADALADARPRQAEDRRFVAHQKETETWLRALHETWPLAFVVQVADAEGGFGPGQWHRVSTLELGPAGAWAEVERAMPELLPVVLAYWASAWAGLVPPERKARLDGMSRAARELLDRHGGVPQVAEAPGAPTLDEKLATFQKARAHRPPIERAYAELLPGGGDLTKLAVDLDAAGLFDACVEVCEAGIRERVAPWVFLSDLEVLALVRGERFSEAEEVLPQALLRTHLYSAEALFAAWIRLLERCDRSEDARAVFHAGLAHMSYFRMAVRQYGVDGAAYGSKAAAGALKRFAALYRDTIAPAWVCDELDRDVLDNARSTFDTLRLTDLLSEAQHELDRRKA